MQWGAFRFDIGNELPDEEKNQNTFHQAKRSRIIPSEFVWYSPKIKH